MQTKPVIFKTLSNMHCGIGQGLSDVDLPVARDKVTGHPLIPGSSIKGVLRDKFTSENKENTELLATIFGPDTSSSGKVDFASAVSFGDAKLLMLPVRSYSGTFAYVASPVTLLALKNALERNGRTSLPPIPAFESNTEHYKGAPTSDTALKIAGNQGRILLEEVDLLSEMAHAASVDNWANLIADILCTDEERKALFRQRFLVVEDNVLDFFCETALPVAARIRIDNEKGTVQEGALWYEESVPPESVFLSEWYATDGRGKNNKYKAAELMEFLVCKPITCQIGGDASTGHGMVSIHFG